MKAILEYFKKDTAKILLRIFIQVFTSAFFVRKILTPKPKRVCENAQNSSQESMEMRSKKENPPSKIVKIGKIHYDYNTT